MGIPNYCLHPNRYYMYPPPPPPSLATSFHRFLHLLAALRVQIWQLSVEPRLVVLLNDQADIPARKVGFDPAPAILHVCAESRKIGLRLYELCKGPWGSLYHRTRAYARKPPWFYFRPEIDVLSMHKDHFLARHNIDATKAACPLPNHDWACDGCQIEPLKFARPQILMITPDEIRDLSSHQGQRELWALYPDLRTVIVCPPAYVQVLLHDLSEKCLLADRWRNRTFSRESPAVGIADVDCPRLWYPKNKRQWLRRKRNSVIGIEQNWRRPDGKKLEVRAVNFVDGKGRQMWPMIGQRVQQVGTVGLDFEPFDLLVSRD